MSKRVKVIVIRTAGTNCDAETAFAFKSFDADVDLVHINKLYSKEVLLKDYHILAIPGGFTYGDNIESGRILANELRLHLGRQIKEFISAKKLVIGICNGFQVLVKAGILPGDEAGFKQTATLINNDSGKFEDRWVHLKVSGRSVWTENLEKCVYFPVAHAEGKFILESKAALEALINNGQVAFQYQNEDGSDPVYPQNPNGSVSHIAGITDGTGRVLGLMPHPERHFLFTQHPTWTKFKEKEKFGQGAKIFENGVKYVTKNLL